MRLVKVNAPEANAEEIKQTAFAAGIESVSLHKAEKYSSDGANESKAVIDIQTSTPKAKRFIEELIAAKYFDPEKISITVRQPRSVLSGESTRKVTPPLEEPGIDLFEELWQFSHITYSLVGRVLIAAGLLGYGLIGQKTLLIIAGLLFLPMLPTLLAIGFGVVTRQWKLALQGFAAFAVSIFLLVLGGVIAALLSEPPMKYDEFNPFLASLVISTFVGVAAGLASIDDTGRREFIGLAAAAQIGIFPVWLGVCIVFGPPPTSSGSEISTHILSLILNTVMIVIAASLVHVASGVVKNMSLIKDS
jgi:hypothetical protein